MSECDLIYCNTGDTASEPFQTVWNLTGNPTGDANRQLTTKWKWKCVLHYCRNSFGRLLKRQ